MTHKAELEPRNGLTPNMLEATLNGICAHSPKCSSWGEHEALNTRADMRVLMKPLRDPEELRAEQEEKYKQSLADEELARRREEVRFAEAKMAKFEKVLRECCPTTQAADAIMNTYVEKFMQRTRKSFGCTRCGSAWEALTTSHSRFCPTCGSSNAQQGYVFEVV